MPAMLTVPPQIKEVSCSVSEPVLSTVSVLLATLAMLAAVLQRQRAGDVDRRGGAHVGHRLLVEGNGSADVDFTPIGQGPVLQETGTFEDSACR